jgi:hypothetical protein
MAKKETENGNGSASGNPKPSRTSALAETLREYGVDEDRIPEDHPFDVMDAAANKGK